MHSCLRAALATIVLGSGLIGQGMLPGTRAVHAAAPVIDRIFAGLQEGIVAATRDAGGSWQEADNGLPSGTDINSLAVAPGGHTILRGHGRRGRLREQRRRAELAG